MGVIGITSTIPVEIVFASGNVPMDLNNVFITSPDPGHYIRRAERDGFPQNVCSWIKGIYGVVLEEGIERVIVVTGGDCSNSIALGELLSLKGVRIIPFIFPHRRDRDTLKMEMEYLMQNLGTDWEHVNREFKRMKVLREKLRTIDRLTFLDGRVSGFENHLFLVSSSDCMKDRRLFEKKVDEFIESVQKRDENRYSIRLGYIGVPPIFTDLYQFVESLGAQIVFNEIQRQFSMPYDCDNIVEQYLAYTYPYDIDGRIKDIREAIEQRAIDGIIHYTQSFCFRQIHDLILREKISTPILTIEGDRPGLLDSRTKLRIETFVEMLISRKDSEYLFKFDS